MKVTKFEIKFDNPRGVFEAGKAVSGIVFLSLAKPIKLRSVKLYFKGEGRVSWQTKRGKTRRKYSATETYLDSFATFVAAGPKEGKVEHPAGDHVYPFTIPLLPSLPSSFEGTAGYVRYFCKATIDRPWKSNTHVKRVFTVIHQLDLNALPVADPFYIEKAITVEGCCCDDGSFDASMELNKTGFVPGEPIVYKVNIMNHSRSPILRLSVELKQVTTYYARSDSVFSSDSLKQKQVETAFVLFNERVNVLPSKSGEVHKATTVPSLPPSYLEGCSLIDLKYIVVLKVRHGPSKLMLEKEVTIGTIPLFVPAVVPAMMPVVVPTAPLEPSAPSLIAPPSYDEALALPPSYEDCIFGTTQVRDENDDDNTDGDVNWAPSYPYYDWSQHTYQNIGGQPPSQATMGATIDDEALDEDGNQSPTQL